MSYVSNNRIFFLNFSSHLKSFKLELFVCLVPIYDFEIKKYYD